MNSVGHSTSDRCVRLLADQGRRHAAELKRMQEQVVALERECRSLRGQLSELELRKR